MVLFHYIGHVPANTTAAAPFWEKLKMLKGTIIQWIPFQPPECADLLQFRVFYHGTQIFPFNPNAWAYGLFNPTRIEDSIEFFDSPYELDFFAINTDDTFEHEYHMYVNIMPTEPIKPGATGEAGLWERLNAFFGGS